MITPKIDWYGRNELHTVSPTTEPTTPEEVLHERPSVAKDVPEYPTIDYSADEIDHVEIKDEGEKEEGDYL